MNTPALVPVTGTWPFLVATIRGMARRFQMSRNGQDNKDLCEIVVIIPVKRTSTLKV